MEDVVDTYTYAHDNRPHKMSRTEFLIPTDIILFLWHSNSLNSKPPVMHWLIQATILCDLLII